jgi:hypothetical protein
MLKTCKKCQENFEITEADLEFYQKISLPVEGGEIPAPTLCPPCRNQRRMAFRNDRFFYHRKCDLSGKPFISIYSPNSPYKVYMPSEWYGDLWDPKDYGREIDFNKSFLQQFKQLMLEVPRLGIDLVNCENSDYCNYCGDDKDCYLDIAGEDNEKCFFNLFVKHSYQVLDSTFVYNSKFCYQCLNCYDCYGCQFCQYCENCNDCLYCFDMKGCKDCLFSHGLRNKQYCIFNKQKTKEEYFKYLESLNLNLYSQRQKLLAGWNKYRQENAIFRDSYFLNCENCSGNNIKNSRNTFDSFNVSKCEDSAYLYDVLDAKDCRDLNYSLYKPELSYELISTLNMVRSGFSMASHYNNEVYYCDLTNYSSNLFGCVGMKRAQYCILNKQYSKEEYFELLPKIIELMRKFGEWGEFFDPQVSPFAYNETVANEYFTLNETSAVEQGFYWAKNQKEQQYKGSDYQIPDDISAVDDDIARQILRCDKSEKLYRVIPQEVQFYRKFKLPIPRVCPEQRHLDRFNSRQKRQLFDRSCDDCGVAVKSVYSNEVDFKVYCEACYLKAVYG